MKDLADGPVKIAACFPRAIKWLFAAAQAPLEQNQSEVMNMRTATAEEVMAGLDNPDLNPNLPSGKPEPTHAPSAEIKETAPNRS